MLHYVGKCPFTSILKGREMLMLHPQQEKKRTSQFSHAQYQSTTALLSSEFQVFAFFTLVRNWPAEIVIHCLIHALVPFEYLLMERARYIKNSYTISSVTLSS